MSTVIPRFGKRERGYVLVLNLAVLALMLLGASFVGQRVSDAVRLAKAEEKSVDDNYRLESARAKLLMALASAPRNSQGLGAMPATVSLDGSEYRLTDSVMVSLQDQRGLVSVNGGNLNGFGRERMERLLGTWGVSDARAAALTDALLDYRDADDLRRINGAERNEYRLDGSEADLRNADLLSVSELPRVWGWRNTPEIWKDDPIIDHVSIQTGTSFNPNTAGWRALVAMAGIDAEAAKNLVASRRSATVFTDISGVLFGQGVGDPFGANSFVMPFPSATVIATLRINDAAWGYRMVLTHTPGENTAPWRMGAAWRVTLAAHPKEPKGVPKFPEMVQMIPVGGIRQIESIF